MRHSLSFVALLLLAGTGPAQTGRGTITGIVRDTSGGVVVGAAIIVTNTETGIDVSVQSQADGAYLAPQLPPGQYRLTATAPGFKRVDIGGLNLRVDTTLTQDVTLEVGVVTESVVVQATSSMVETTSGQVGTTVQIAHVIEMPLVDRNVFRLTNLVPGAMSGDRGPSVGGGRINETVATLDGVNDTRGGLGTQGVEISPPVDAVQEFKVEVNSMSAEYGRSTGGFLAAVTRGGTNQFHGSFYEFVRNNKFDATRWGNDSKPPLRCNNFGGSIGGRIIRDRTFFFYNYDGLRERDPDTRTRDVGLPEWRSGDFSRAMRDANGRAAPVTIYDPETGTGTFTSPRGTQAFPGNRIPSSRFDPVAVKALAYMPAPNRVPNNPLNNSGNWQENISNSSTRDYNTIRIDHKISGSTTMFGRYILVQPVRQVNGYSKAYGPADPDGTSVENRQQNFALNVTHLFSPSLFVTFTTGFTRTSVHRMWGDCCDTNYAGQLGLSNVPGGYAFPRFTFAGGLVPVTALGASGNADRVSTFTNSEWNLNFTKVLGGHTLKFGASNTRYNGNDRTNASPSGAYNFSERFTRGIDASGNVIANTGIRLADFLLGRLESVSANVGPTIGKRIQYYSGYFQDDWRFSSRLTLNFGMRYEIETPVHEVAGRITGFNPWAPNPLAGTGDIPAGAIGIMLFPNRNGVHQTPFICQTEAAGLGAPLDANCSANTAVSYVYKSTAAAAPRARAPHTGANRELPPGFKVLDPSAPRPADVAENHRR